MDFGAVLALGFETEPFGLPRPNPDSGFGTYGKPDLVVPFGLPRPNPDLGFGTYGKPDLVVPLGRPRPCLTGAFSTSVDSAITSASSAIFFYFQLFFEKKKSSVVVFDEAKQAKLLRLEQETELFVF